MLLVLAVCGVSLAHAADSPSEPCGLGKTWGPAKVENSAATRPYAAIPAIPITFVDVSRPAPRWARAEDTARASSRAVLVQPRATRAPPLA